METSSTEERVLDVLEADAQASVSEVAERAGVSKPTVRKYVRKLEEDGVIVGYRAEVDPKKLSGRSIALVGIEVESERYVEASRALADLEAIRTLYTSSGDHMLMAEVHGADGSAVGDVIEDEILETEGVTAAHPSFLQERLK